MIQKIAVIGQGYVGLPLALIAAESGLKVIGIDTDTTKISRINRGISDIEDITSEKLKFNLSSGNYNATSDYSMINDADVIIVCVPTPLNLSKKPDLTYLLSAVKSLSSYLSKNSLLIIESTVAPGTTREVLVPLILRNSKIVHEDLKIVYSPERVDPTNLKWSIKNTPKLLSGMSKLATEKAIDFYSNFVDEIIEVDSLEVAETAKLLENSFRLINISFINEFSKVCRELEINIDEVITAASTKPYGFMPFYPSIGVGGHCIPVDPIYLAEKAAETGVQMEMISMAFRINQEMPTYFISRIEEKLGALKGKRILVVGVSYKPNVADVRETAVEILIKNLIEREVLVFWHDDLVKVWNGTYSTPLSSNYDLAILATPHDYLDLTKLGNVPILNTRGSI